MTLGIRGTPKILIIFLGVPAKFLKKVGVLPGAAKGSRRLAGAASRRRQNPFAAPGKTPTFFKNLAGTPKKIIKILGVPLTPKSKNANFSS